MSQSLSPVEALREVLGYLSSEPRCCGLSLVYAVHIDKDAADRWREALNNECETALAARVAELQGTITILGLDWGKNPADLQEDARAMRKRLDASTPDLSLVDSHALIYELLKRVDHGVFIVMQERLRADGAHGYVRSWKGNSHTCIGLCHDMQDTILQELRGTERAAEHDRNDGIGHE